MDMGVAQVTPLVDSLMQFLIAIQFCITHSMYNCNSLVPSHLCAPVENVWWFDLNFLSLTPFSFGM